MLYVSAVIAIANLLSLPLEIRNIIYDYILCSPPPGNIVIGGKRDPPWTAKPHTFRLPPEVLHLGLQLTNRQLYHEFRAAIQFLVKAYGIDYEFELKRNFQQAWIELFPVLQSTIHRITFNTTIANEK